MIGAILAGGRGRRMGGGKPARLLAGRPLIAWPAEALAAACGRVVVVAKGATELPELPGVERWDEPDDDHHPARGIAFALERAAGEPVLVCAADMPFLTAEACTLLADGLGREKAAVAVADGVMQPVFAAYAPWAAADFRAAFPDAALTRTVDAMRPVLVEVDPRVVRSVDTEDHLAAAAAELGPGPVHTANPFRPKPVTSRLAHSVLVQGVDDWVGLWEVARLAREITGASAESEVRDRAVAVIRELHDRGLIEVGWPTRDGAFESWGLDPSEAAERIDAEWRALAREPTIGEIGWLSNTARGDAEATRA